MKFLIYNFAGKGWWTEHMHGLTGNRHEAGQFDVDQAAEILDAANRAGREDIAVPVNRVYFDTGEALRSYANLFAPTLPPVRVGEALH